MYEGVVENESSAVKLQTVASAIWPPPPPVPLNFPLNYQLPPAFFDNQQLPPHSLTQTLLLGGRLAGEDDKLGLILIQEKNRHNWDQQLLAFSTKSNQDPSSQFSANCNYSRGGVAKKAKIQHSSAKTSTTNIKVRKEKLGDKITALHQLVSPFGKTDTATVLLEAIGYIKFLEKQVEALSVPYMGRGSEKSMRQQHLECDEEPKKELRSRGLCLVPLSCTLDVGSENGADYWAPNIGEQFR